MKQKKTIWIILAALLLPAIASAQPVIGSGGTGEYRSLILKERGTTLGECQTINMLASLDVSKTGEACSLSNTARAFNVMDYMTCDLTSDHTATLRTLIETTAAGRTIFVPSGCKLLLGSPGAGDSVADVPSNTTIECEDSTAGFVLARKSCSDASATPGAACTADNQCSGGTCVADYTSGDSFAPNSGSTYTVFGAAASTVNQAIKRCGIWTNQGSGDSPVMGGDGKRWGYCDGTGGSDVLGEGCYNACNAASGIAFEGLACLANTDCNVGGAGTPGSCVAVAGGCKAGGGQCGSVPYSTAWGASGAGKINPIAWANASGALVQDVTIYDHRIGDAGIDAGTRGRVVRSSTRADTLTTAQQSASLFGANMWLIGSGLQVCFNFPSGCLTPTVTKGIVAGTYTDVVESTGWGWSVGVHAKGYNHITDAVGGGYGDPQQTGWNGNTDLMISDAGVQVDGFVGGTSLYCILPEFNKGYNFLVDNAYCDGNIGPKFIVQGSGNQYMGVRGAWSGKGSVLGLSDQRGRCSAGDRANKVCLFGTGSDATIGCNGGACNAHDDFPAGSANHFIVGGGSLLHTDQGALTAFVRATDSKRCVNSGASDFGGPCTVDGDCSVGACDYLTWGNALFDGVQFYYGNNSVAAFELSTSGVGASVQSNAPSIFSWTIDGVNFNNFPNVFKFPAISRVCLGGTNDGTACTADGTCTGSGKCRGQVENFVASGNVFGSTTPLTNWDWSYGDVTGLKGLLTTDTQGEIVSKTADGAITKGQLVKTATTADRVVAIAVNEGSLVVGLALNDAQSGWPVKVLTSGQGQCITDSGTIAIGDLLKASGSNGGRVVTGSTASGDVIVGVANATDGSTNTLFNCTIRPPAVQAVIASPFLSVRKPSDTGRTVASVSADPDFQFTTGSNKKYAVDGMLIVSQTNTSSDIQGGFDIPGTSTGTVNVSVVGGQAIGNPSLMSADNSAIKLGEVPNGTTQFFLSGTLTTVTSGTTSFIWAQNSGPGATTTILAGSFIRLMEIP